MKSGKKLFGARALFACALMAIGAAGAWAAETKAKPDAVGDVVLNDGTAIAFENIKEMDESQKANAMAVIFYVGTECSNNEKPRTLGVGLRHATATWNNNKQEIKGNGLNSLIKDGTGVDMRLDEAVVAEIDLSPEIDTIKIKISVKTKNKKENTKGNKLFSITNASKVLYDTDSYVFEGKYKDGSDNLALISASLKKQNLPDDTVPVKDAASFKDENYSAFYFAKDYKDFQETRTEEPEKKEKKEKKFNALSLLGAVKYEGPIQTTVTSNVGEAFKDGWYLPTIVELFQIWKSKDKLDEALAICGGDKFEKREFWSSSQYAEIEEDGETFKSLGGIRHYAWTLNFGNGKCGSGAKSTNIFNVCAIREF